MRPDVHEFATGLPEIGTVQRLLTRVIRRTMLADTLRGAAVATAIAAVMFGVLGRSPRAVGVAAATSVAPALLIFWRRRATRTSAGAARAIERAQPECRNVIITAAELVHHPDRATSRMRARVFGDASAQAGTIRIAQVVPIGRAVSLLALAGMLAAAVAMGVPRAALDAVRRADGRGADGSGAGEPGAMTVTASVHPPSYTGLAPQALVNPERIEAVQGSLLRLTVNGPARAWRVRFGTAPLAVSNTGTTTVAHATLSQSGYVAIEPADGDERGEARRQLIAVAVSPDRAPVIRIDTPGKDLLLPDAGSPVGVSAAASDDFGLHAFELRYTKVSGSGEQFEFIEGTLPLSVSRESGRAWTAQGRIVLSSLRLEPGDSLVYRAVARDGRPGDAGFASSDTYFIEIAGPGQAALEGFALPPDQERYALSQQMIVLKLQRLRARERLLARSTVEEQTAAIAAEQRAVRANFIFLMGGHVEDEEAEAEQSHEIQEGRLANTARKEISAAVHHMSRVEQGLAAVDTSAALPQAKAAVEALQRAFGRNRYILRTLAVRSRVDPSRRLTGELSSAGDWRRELHPATLDPKTRDARAILSRILDVAASIRAERHVDPSALATLAEQALAIDPAAADWQLASRRILAVREALSAGRATSELNAALNAALAPVLAQTQRGARPAASRGTRSSGALLSAWAEEARR